MSKSKLAIMLMVIVFTLGFFIVIGAVVLSTVKAPTTNSSTKTYTITLERGPCFGFCPAYKVVINADGKVDFYGERFTSGDYSYSISQDQLDKLLKQVEQVDVFKYNDEYIDQRITDLPSARLTINGVSRQKSITMYGLQNTIPQELTDLTKLIDEVADTKQWFATAS